MKHFVSYINQHFKDSCRWKTNKLNIRQTQKNLPGEIRSVIYAWRRPAAAAHSSDSTQLLQKAERRELIFFWLNLLKGSKWVSSSQPSHHWFYWKFFETLLSATERNRLGLHVTVWQEVDWDMAIYFLPCDSVALNSVGWKSAIYSTNSHIWNLAKLIVTKDVELRPWFFDTISKFYCSFIILSHFQLISTSLKVIFKTYFISKYSQSRLLLFYANCKAGLFLSFLYYKVWNLTLKNLCIF